MIRSLCIYPTVSSRPVALLFVALRVAYIAVHEMPVHLLLHIGHIVFRGPGTEIGSLWFWDLDDSALGYSAWKFRLAPEATMRRFDEENKGDAT
jgi:hypothetical protein